MLEIEKLNIRRAPVFKYGVSRLIKLLCVKMNYDEYIDEVQKYSSDDAVFRFVAHLNDWKSNETNVIELANSIERFFGNSWITSEETHSHLYQVWSSFKDAAVSGIGSMTMNERLYLFGLFERFDTCKSDTEKKVIYAKLCANT